MVDGTPDESAACAANAAVRRDQAFARADSATLGAQAALVVQNAALSALRPFGPTTSRSTRRLIALSGRAALRLVRISRGRRHDHALLVERLDRARADFLTSFARPSAEAPDFLRRRWRSTGMRATSSGDS